MALGATVVQALKTIALPGIGWVVAGTAAGIAAARLAFRVLTRMTSGIAAGDPLTYAAVAVLLTLVEIGASLTPQRLSYNELSRATTSPDALAEGEHPGAPGGSPAGACTARPGRFRV